MTEISNYSPYGHPKGHTDPVTGLWVRNEDSPADDGDVEVMSLKFAISFATLDGATLYTIPPGASIQLTSVFWEITTPFSGGASSSIGVSCASGIYNTKGALLGGAAGDVAATLIAGTKKGTQGSAFATDVVILPPGSVIRFDRITSAFTAGAGFVHVDGRVAA